MIRKTELHQTPSYPAYPLVPKLRLGTPVCETLFRE
jgi:hypothetical protein